MRLQFLTPIPLFVKMKFCRGRSLFQFHTSDKRVILGLLIVAGFFVLSHLAAPNTPIPSQAGEAVPSDMVLIPKGSFVMGSNKRLPDEGPKHSVYLPDFYMDKYEVSNSAYLQFVRADQRQPPIYWRRGMPPAKKIDHPVVFVTWFDAIDYCHWKEKRLPSAMEWEKAARGLDERTYPWGDTFDKTKANTPYSKRKDTMAVGSFPSGRSPFGVYDMSGNVWEWTSSWYKAYPGNKRKRLMTYGERYRVLKGGSFINCSFYKCGISAPVYNRSFFKPATKNQGFGFRCAKSV